LLSHGDTLKFNWPSSIKAEVQFENTNTIKQGRNSQQHIERGQFVIQADKKMNSILLQIQGYKVVQLTPSVEQMGLAQLENEVSRLIRELPRYWIEDNGESLSLELEDDFLSRISIKIDEMLQTYPEQARSGLKEMLVQLVSPHRIRSKLEYEWNNRVGFWIDREYSQDQEVEVFQVVNIPTLGNGFIPVRVRSRYSMLGKAICERDGQHRDCVVLQLISEPANPNLKELKNAVLGAQAQQINLNIVSSIKVTVEPDTLLTHRIEAERRIGFYDNDGLVLERIQQRIHQYQYN